MKTWIALLRGINVGGNNILPMAQLKDELRSINLKNVKTYIRSGNVVFDSQSKSARPLAQKIGQLVEEKHGFRPAILLFDAVQLKSAIENNPFPDATADPKSLHFFFLEKPAHMPDIEAIDNAKTKQERYALTETVFYLHAPSGIARSKLAKHAEKYLGVTATARNFRTVEKLASMVDD